MHVLLNLSFYRVVMWSNHSGRFCVKKQNRISMKERKVDGKTDPQKFCNCCTNVQVGQTSRSDKHPGWTNVMFIYRSDKCRIIFSLKLDKCRCALGSDKCLGRTVGQTSVGQKCTPFGYLYLIFPL
jgi:hypothetical protein